MRIFTRHNKRHLHKKSSLNLSINAIVILILAITMLGLGLGFIRNIFNKATTGVIGSLDGITIQNPPSADNPLTVSPDPIQMNQGDTNSNVVIAFYNRESVSLNCQLSILSRNQQQPCGDGDFCAFTTTVGETITFLYTDTLVQDIAPGADKGWRLIIQDPSTKDVDFYTAQLACVSGNQNFNYEKDFVINTRG